MTRDEVKVEFTGLVHDHLMINRQENIRPHSEETTSSTPLTTTTTNSETDSSTNFGLLKQKAQSSATALSTIAILRRHPMYDSLVLVKRYRACLNGYTLEFPTTGASCSRDSMKTNVSKEHDCCKTKLVSYYLDGDDPIYQCQERNNKNNLSPNEGEITYVPMNGLIDRLDNYDRHGIAIDSRVYAFAMGLKTAEKFLKTSSMKEIQETPPL